MESAGTTAPQCCELYFNYFTVLLTGSSSIDNGGNMVRFSYRDIKFIQHIHQIINRDERFLFGYLRKRIDDCFK